ncbi:HD domain-containing protein [Saccharolobus solfataricus]|nr:HD domain-containing protein [Saccharolobus solfataricus]
MAYMIFPSMRHTRFEHSLGTYYIASKMIDRIEGNIDSDFKEIIKKLALYHDIGHFPFSHTFEFALDVLKYLNDDKYKEIIGLTEYKGQLHKFHEMMGIKILKDGLGEKEVADLMENVYTSSNPLDDKIKIAKLIVNSDLDADRLDYLQRDSYYSGAKFGIIDPERIIITMTITPKGYIFPPKAIDDLEHFFLARFHMYSSVYNHPVIEIYNRVMSYFIAFAIHKGLLKIPSNLEEIKTFTDEQVFLALINAKNDNELSHFYFSLVERRKYKRAVLQGSEARTLHKYLTEDEDAKEFYEYILGYKGKVVIGSTELKTSIDNIQIKEKLGKYEYLNNLKEESSVVKPPERFRVHIGVYDDNVAKEISEYFSKNFSITLDFRNLESNP